MIPPLLILALAAGAQYVQNFEEPDSLKAFVFSDPDAWRYGAGFLELQKQSEYEPPHRSPLNIALIDGRQYGSFTLEADLMSTEREYEHRDMCLFFNFQDPAHFYYVHIATRSDPHAHNIFIVNGAPRLKVSTLTNDGHDWGSDQWHKVRLKRDAESGLIELFINEQKIMEASDKTLTRGHIGFGSFDDKGRIDNIRITGEPVSPGKAAFFKGHNAPAQSAPAQ